MKDGEWRAFAFRKPRSLRWITPALTDRSGEFVFFESGFSERYSAFCSTARNQTIHPDLSDIEIFSVM